MNVQNRWVPMELMNTLWVSGLVMALIILGMLFWLRLRKKKDKPKIHKKRIANPQKKHRPRKAK